VKVLDVFLKKNKKYLADGERRPHIGFRAINSDQEAIADIVNVPESVCPNLSCPTVKVRVTFSSSRLKGSLFPRDHQ
jgi:hypothetical protein